VLLAVLLSRTPAAEIIANFRSVAASSIATAVLLLFATSWFIAVRWRVILGLFGAVVRLPAAWRYTLIGAFFNQVLPSGMGGDIFRAWYARRFAAVTPGKAIASVVVDRVLGFIAITLIVL